MAAGSTRNLSRGCWPRRIRAQKETASWIIGRHRDWADALAGVLGERLVRIDLSPADRTELERQLGRFAQAAPIQRLLAARLRDAFALSAARRSSLQAMAWSNLKAKAVPREWVDAIAGVLEGDPATPNWSRRPSRPCVPCRSPGKRPVTCPAACSGSPPTAKNAAELRLAGPRRRSRRRWSNPIKSSSTFLIEASSIAIGRWRPERPRPTCWRGPSSQPISSSALPMLLRTAGPLEVDRLLAAFEQSTDTALGLEAR